MNPEQGIRNNLLRIQEKILSAQETSEFSHPITIVGVTKTHPPEIITAAINAGLTNIGENRVQEALDKFNKLQVVNRITKHMIGHLQSNKINKAVETFDRIDTIDSKKLANKINKRAVQLNKTIPALLEINISGEKQKYGFPPEEIDDILSCLEKENLKIEGLMTIGPLTENQQDSSISFSRLRLLLKNINGQLPEGHTKLKTLSMGMSNDYLIGVKEGSTMVRIGTAIFGPRGTHI
ncbi:MAG TPA: YggS family pyridoxal phosphate-dependent enzyme [Nitrospinaceae bacterium]|nr:YggS family pyridoxal phosphate-dependent enzyme [Nitrospinaceae bacterium]